MNMTGEIIRQPHEIRAKQQWRSKHEELRIQSYEEVYSC